MPAQLQRTGSKEAKSRSLNDIALGGAVIGLLVTGVLGILGMLVYSLASNLSFAFLPAAVGSLFVSVLAFGLLLFALRPR